MKLKTGDKVVIVSGDNKGKSGKIVKMDVKNHKAFIEGIEIRERHLKKTQFIYLLKKLSVLVVVAQ